MKNLMGNYQNNRDYEISYDMSNNYYDNRYMNHMQQYNYGGTGPLYNYLQGQSYHHMGMMYPPSSDYRRNWGGENRLKYMNKI